MLRKLLCDVLSTPTHEREGKLEGSEECFCVSSIITSAGKGRNACTLINNARLSRPNVPICLREIIVRIYLDYCHFYALNRGSNQQ